MSQVGKYLNLKPHMSSWRVYNQNGPYTTAYSIGSLAPAQFGGLSYRIRGEKGNDVYLIQTESFGLCAIWAPVDNDSTITTSPTYSNGDTSAVPSPTPISRLNQVGFAKDFGVEFTSFETTKTIATLPGVTIKLRASLKHSYGNKLVGKFDNLKFSEVVYQKEFASLTAELSKSGFTLSKHFSVINEDDYTISAITTVDGKTIVEFEQVTPVTGAASAVQVLIYEFDDNKIKALTSTEKATIKSKLTALGKIGVALITVALAVYIMILVLPIIFASLSALAASIIALIKFILAITI